PPPAGGTSAAPTGVVFNGTTTDFVVSGSGTSAPARFIFATEDGTISGWAPQTGLHDAILEVDNSANPSADNGAVYKGLALSSVWSARACSIHPGVWPRRRRSSVVSAGISS